MSFFDQNWTKEYEIMYQCMHHNQQYTNKMIQLKELNERQTNRWFLFSFIQTQLFCLGLCAFVPDRMNDQNDMNNTHFEAF